MDQFPIASRLAVDVNEDNDHSFDHCDFDEETNLLLPAVIIKMMLILMRAVILSLLITVTIVLVTLILVTMILVTMIFVTMFLVTIRTESGHWIGAQWLALLLAHIQVIIIYAQYCSYPAQLMIIDGLKYPGG